MGKETDCVSPHKKTPLPQPRMLWRKIGNHLKSKQKWWARNTYSYVLLLLATVLSWHKNWFFFLDKICFSRFNQFLAFSGSPINWTDHQDSPGLTNRSGPVFYNYGKKITLFQETEKQIHPFYYRSNPKWFIWKGQKYV